MKLFRLVVGCFCFAVLATTVQAVELSPTQLELLQQLSPQQKAALAKQAGIDLPQKEPERITNPPVVKPRPLKTGPAEREFNSFPSTTAENQARKPDGGGVPIAAVRTQPEAERIEIQQAFADIKSEAKPLTVDTRLHQFGYDLFAGSPTTFAPATDIPIPPEYVLGPGDEIKVQLFGKTNSEFTLTVDREGVVAFPELGPVPVAGMRFVDAKALIAQRVKDEMIGVTSRLAMGKLRSIRIFALGEVARPGSYVVSGLATLSHALFVSGGVKKTGSLRNVQLKRNGRVVATIDLYEFLLNGNTRGDVRLLPQDVVYVPPIGVTVGVAGQVLRPAIYELKKEKTVKDLLALAGDLRPTAYRKKVQIERIREGIDRQVLDVYLEDQAARTRVRGGDLIKVFSVLDFEENPVYLLGNVKRPGKYAWRKGLTLRDLVPDGGALLPETFMDYGIIERESAVGREPTIVHFPLGKVLSGQVSISLQPRDKVYLFARARFRQQPVVSIGGSVQQPGSYVWKKNMHLADLIFAAGGLTRDSFLESAELYRTDPQTKEVHLLKVDLGAALAGSERDNLLLQDLDRLVVHSVWEVQRRWQVAVYGEVKNPGQFSLSEKMRVSDLVFAAGNVTEMAYLKEAELTRYRVDNGETRVSRYLRIDLEAALRGDSDADLVLQPYDVLLVRRLENWRPIEQVTVKGEVRFPGKYPVEEGERLSALLVRTGGFTSKAYLPAAVFTRKAVRRQQEQQLMRSRLDLERAIAEQEAALGSLTDPKQLQEKTAGLASARKVLEQMMQLQVTGRMVIQLSDLESLRGSSMDIRLQDGDTLYIPQRPDHVLVMGEVYSPNALVYREATSFKDYLRMAGGTTRMADTSRMYIVRADGEVEPAGGWFAQTLQPGDSLVVPQDLEPFDLLGTSLDWSKVLYQLGVAMASMKTIGVL